jgi:hypothetical protein
VLASTLWSNRRSLVNRARPSCARGRRGALDQGWATGQGRLHLPGWPNLQGPPDQVVRPCLGHVARWFQFLPKCVSAYEIHNTTRETLLVLEMCMKLVIYSSRTRGFDGRIFVVRTVNTTSLFLQDPKPSPKPKLYLGAQPSRTAVRPSMRRFRRWLRRHLVRYGSKSRGLCLSNPHRRATMSSPVLTT